MKTKTWECKECGKEVKSKLKPARCSCGATAWIEIDPNKKVMGVLYLIGKSRFVISPQDDLDAFWVWRLVRGRWTFLGETETESQAISRVLHAVSKIAGWYGHDEK